MKIKKLTAIAGIVVLISGILAGCGNSAQPEDDTAVQNAETVKEAGDGTEVTLTIWSYTDQLLTPVIEEYKKDHPNVNFEVTYVTGSEIYQKIVASLATGQELPDLIAHEATQRGSILSLDVWENLESDAYGLNRDIFFDASIPLITNSDDEVVCIPWDMDMCGLAYKKDLAREYFGTDNPDELEKLMPDWTAFINEGKRVLSESNNGVFMFPSLSDASTIISRQNAAPYFLEDGSLDLCSTWQGAMNTLSDMRDAGIVKGISMWTPAWAASFGEKDCIFYPCATWMPLSYISENAPDDSDNWALMLPPEGACIWGGTAIGLTNTSQHKEEAWEFLDYFLSDEGISLSKSSSGFFTHVKSAYDNEEFTSWTTAQFGAQDIGEKFFSDAFTSAQVREVTQYDEQIDSAANLVLQSMITDSSIDGAKALEMMADELTSVGLEMKIIYQ